MAIRMILAVVGVNHVANEAGTLRNMGPNSFIQRL